MRLPKHEQWILAHRNDPVALENRISNLIWVRQTKRLFAWTWATLAIAFMALTVSPFPYGSPGWIVPGAFFVLLAAITFPGVHRCSVDITVMALLHSECSGDDREPPQEIAQPDAG